MCILVSMGDHLIWAVLEISGMLWSLTIVESGDGHETFRRRMRSSEVIGIRAVVDIRAVKVVKSVGLAEFNSTLGVEE